MLVLTRKRDEEIKIGSNIVIRVIKTGTGSVKIGIDAPPSVRVMRGELATLEVDQPLEISVEQLDGELDECLVESLMFQH